MVSCRIVVYVSALSYMQYVRYDIIRLLRLNPSTAIPVILKRLKQKDVEWRRARENMKKTWQDVVKANYHRSLDHRSFTFKSEEKKRLSSKFLIAELKDLCEKMAEGAEEKGVFTNASLQPSLYNYCMNFSLDDQAVHPELLDLIERCINHLPDEDRSQLLSFWNGFVLHFLNATDKSDLLDGPDVGYIDSCGSHCIYGLLHRLLRVRFDCP